MGNPGESFHLVVITWLVIVSISSVQTTRYAYRPRGSMWPTRRYNPLPRPQNCFHPPCPRYYRAQTDSLTDEDTELERAVRQWSVSGGYDSRGHTVNARVNYKRGNFDAYVGGHYSFGGGGGGVQAGFTYTFGKRRRRAANPDEGTTTNTDGVFEETDVFYVDQDGKTQTDVIKDSVGSQIVHYDFKRAIVVVKVPSQKTCYLHQMPPKMTKVDLRKQEKIFYYLEKDSAKDPIETAVDPKNVAEFKISSKPVSEKELGPKIVKLCKESKKQWMEYDDGTKEDDIEQNEAQDEITDNVEDENTDRAELEEREFDDDADLMIEKDFEPPDVPLEKRTCKTVWTCNDVRLKSKKKVMSTNCCKWTSTSWWKMECTKYCQSNIFPEAFRFSCENVKKC